MKLDAAIGEYLRSSTNEESRVESILEITQSISNKEVTLLDLVSALGDYLTESDGAVRSRSMQLLQRVLGEVPSGSLSGQHVTVMTQFFCDRLSDDVCLSDSLSALTSISKMSRFAEADAQNAAGSVLSISTDARQFPQRTRFQIYTLLESLMARKRNALKDPKLNFVSGFSKLMDGEKDPRILMLAFSIMKVVLEEFDIVSSVVDLFDVVYCYFPITFRPPPDDPTSITTEDLKGRLRGCLCATHQFSPYLIPALIEKLNAVAVSVKKDTLLTLTAACSRYSARSIDGYTSQLWAALKFEIIQSEDGSLEQVALEVMTSITASLARGLHEMPRQSSLSRWLQPIVVEALDQLKEPELKSAKPCGKILKSVATASAICLQIVVQSILPGLLAILDETKEPNRRASLLEVLGSILEAAEVNNAAKPSSETSSLAPMKADLLQQITRSLVGPEVREFEMRKVALLCSVKLFSTRNLLTDGERRIVIQHVSDLLIDGGPEVANEALSALTRISALKPDLILECTFPVLLAKLPSDIHDGLEESEKRDFKTILNYLAKLSEHRVVFDTLIVRVLSRLDNEISSGTQSPLYSLQLLLTLRQAMRHLVGDSSRQHAELYPKLVPQIFERSIKNIDSVMSQPEALEISAEIVNLACRSLPIDQQQLLAADLFSLYITGGINTLVKHMDFAFRPFDVDCKSLRQSNTIALFVGAYSGLRNDLEIINHLNLDFVVRTMNLLKSCNERFPRLCLLRLMCLMLNKAGSEVEISTAIAHLRATERFLDASNWELLMWICKSLLLRSHKDAQSMCATILTILDDTEYGPKVASGASILIGDDDLLSKDNHCVIKRLYKQKFYALVVPELLQKASTSPMGKCSEIENAVKKANVAERRPNYLVTLTTIVANVPQTVIQADIPNLMPVLLQSLLLHDQAIRQSAITTIAATLPEASDVVALHLSSLIPQMIDFASGSASNSPVSLPNHIL